MPPEATQQKTAQNRNELVQVTDRALAKMQGLLKDNLSFAGISFGVEGGGCAGLQYKMEPVTEIAPDMMHQAIPIENGTDVNLYFHPIAVAYLKGMTIDFSDALMDGGFKFMNPNAANTCGCGTSFGV